MFQELRAKSPEGVRYIVLTYGDSFLHYNPLRQRDAFKSFQGGVRDRCAEPPQASVIIVGNYRMLCER